jgi:uncharacterized Zn finger protein (UPF0148 family)
LDITDLAYAWRSLGPIQGLEVAMPDEKCPECGEPVVEGRLNCPNCGSVYENLENKDLERDPEEQG